MALPTPRPGIMDIKAYVGGEGRGDFASPVRLASNENALGSSEKAVAAYLKAVSELNRYPDGAVAGLREALGQEYGLDPAKIVCGAGSEQLISLLIGAYAGEGDNIVYSQYGFAMYAIMAKGLCVEAIAAPEKPDLRTDIDAMLAAVTPKTKIMMVANPNNPTGSYLTKDEMRKLREGLREDVLLVVDSAYSEFVHHADYENGEKMVDAYNNVVMLRTFSKIYGLAALRIGWGYFPEAVAEALNRTRAPFNVSVPAQAAGIAALADKDFLKRTVDMNDKGLAQVGAGLAALGVKVYPSVGNFVLAQFGPRAEEVRLALKAQGIFVRQMGAYGLPECLRITIGTEIDNARLLSVLGAFLQA